jgi:L-threonylcarbamoyladenylate synthase
VAAAAAVTRSLGPAEAAACLRRGGVVAYPTETFYALGALWSHPGALQRLAEAKRRPLGKPLPLLASDRDQVREVAPRLSPAAERLADRFWPGPLTLVLPASPSVPEVITAGTGSVGIRIPGSEIARSLAAGAGGALISTSANLSGASPPLAPSDLDPALLLRIDGVLDAGPSPGGLASTVVEALEGGTRLLRAGAVPWAEILEALG